MEYKVVLSEEYKEYKRRWYAFNKERINASKRAKYKDNTDGYRDKRQENAKRYYKEARAERLKIPVKCGWCGKDFLPDNFIQKYCSDECVRKVRRSDYMKWYWAKGKEKIRKYKAEWQKNYYWRKKDEKQKGK